MLHKRKADSTIPGAGVASPAPGKEFRRYVHPGDAEPPAVIAARERHRAISAEIERHRERARFKAQGGEA